MRTALTRLHLLLLLVATAFPPLSSAGPLERVAFLGASATHGFGARIAVEDEMRTTDLGRTFAAAMRADGVNISRHSSWLFFRNPDRYGRMLLDAAHKQKPTLVVAIDYLFWYGYGVARSEDARLERLETGLQRLEELDCPVIVGDFPDMTPAVGGMISAAQMPASRTLERMNERVRAWAAAKPDARLLFPLAELVADMQSGRPIQAGGHHWRPGECPPLIQRDQLHPTTDGLIAIVQRTVDMLEASELDVDTEVFELDPDAIKARMSGLMANRSRRATARE